MVYLLLKWVHVLAAISAVGANATYGIWIAAATRQGAALPFTLKTIRRIDDRVANPAYGVIFVSGLVQVFVGHLPFSLPWLSLAMTLFVVMAGIGMAGYSPTLRRQIDALERHGAASPEYQTLARRGRTLGIVLGVISLAIVYLMVVKPMLWS